MMHSTENIKIDFFDSINPNSTKAFIEELKSLSIKKPNASSIWINISSPGGEIDMAIELYSFLKELDCCVITNNCSIVNSAAIIMYLAGTKRYCNFTSSFYVHSVTKKLRGVFDEERLLKEAKELKINTDRIIKILSTNTNRSMSYWRYLMKKGDVITSQQAIKLGLSTDILCLDE